MTHDADAYGRRRRVRRALRGRRWLAAVAAALLMSLLVAPPASAYEYQTGNGVDCRPYASSIPEVTGTGYGDMNVYSTWGLEGTSYNVPYNQLTFAQGYVEQDYTNASAADAENYVVSVGAQCRP